MTGVSLLMCKKNFKPYLRQFIWKKNLNCNGLLPAEMKSFTSECEPDTSLLW